MIFKNKRITSNKLKGSVNLYAAFAIIEMRENQHNFLSKIGRLVYFEISLLSICLIVNDPKTNE